MSFIEEKRREQIVDATIRVIARQGVAQASLSRIAAEAGIAKSIISYHFAGKDALFEEVFGSVVARIGRALAPAIGAAATPWDRIAAYIGGQLAYMRGHRDELLAIGHISLGHVGTAGTPAYIEASAADEQALLRDWLQDGQRSGAFRAFDPVVMAATISAAVEGALTQWATDPATDLAHYTSELLALFARALRADADG